MKHCSNNGKKPKRKLVEIKRKSLPNKEYTVNKSRIQRKVWKMEELETNARRSYTGMFIMDVRFRIKV